ncbi:MAG TPA: hypothetical protein PLI47_11990, partial [Bacteroidia bacterium]|nr:hypothetical protein [Bacteroidota bacterium]MBK7572556.1 hypothetical protein [Bacteroidota bacterium]MBK8585939.1 hypothetical protein [Bacteroidota bacterium]MBP9790691.1 hypothetical protein [Bacteroidia bacterium]HQW24014.1 hypothetical protein [Bacteroidia bacterium]
MKKVIFSIIMIIFFFACKKEEVAVPDKTGNISFSLGYEADGQAIITDTIKYPIDAGYLISVVTLNYYLSEVKLIRSDGVEVLVKDFHYASLNDTATNVVSCSSALQGTYKGISFNIGIDSAHNVPDGLPNTTDNNNMIWPIPMGGGYHFMKFEGYFSDSTGTFGYAMHIGKNENLVKINLDKNFTIGDNAINIPLIMNVNEWFRNPYIYDFNVDGNYSMSSGPAMDKLKSNGSDVFHF